MRKIELSKKLDALESRLTDLIKTSVQSSQILEQKFQLLYLESNSLNNRLRCLESLLQSENLKKLLGCVPEVEKIHPYLQNINQENIAKVYNYLEEVKKELDRLKVQIKLDLGD